MLGTSFSGFSDTLLYLIKSVFRALSTTSGRQKKESLSVSGLAIFFCIYLFSVEVLADDSHKNRVKGPFASGPEVTRVCLQCHETQAHDFVKNEHWTWSSKQSVPNHGEKIEIGKKGSVNNFCIAVPSNWPQCTSCHAGYGWKDASFDFFDSGNIDCLVCHDTTGTYEKDREGAGAPSARVDLAAVAQSVGRTSRKTCGSCHFYGGGGDHVKHGDLDSSLLNPKRNYDVHMGTDGPNATCQFCHQTINHDIPGQAMSVSVGEGSRVECGGCHGRKPHDSLLINRHSQTVACQTCHIPTFAKSKPTKIWWDWSKAGVNQKPVTNDSGAEIYSKSKGEFGWGQNLIPEYAWYNGMSDRYVLGDQIDPDNIVYLSRPLGRIGDAGTKIYPFKVMQGKQPYDAENNYLAVPKLFGGFWVHFDWNRALTDGMAAAGLAYSGSYDFVQTKMYWQITHMVVPKEQALACQDCHSATGRLDWKSLGYDRDPGIE